MSEAMKLAVLCFAGALAGMASAQTLPDAGGIPTASSTFPVEHGFVNLANGALHLEIPVVNYSQRGNIQQPITIVYDSNIWKANYNSSLNSSYWAPNAISPAGNTTTGGWYVSFAQQNQSMAFLSALSFICASNGAGGELIPGFTWIDQHGTTHAFPTIVTAGGGGLSSCTGTDGKQYTMNTNASAYAVDGSGYLGVVGFNPAQGTNFSLNVYDKDGTLVASNSFNQPLISTVGGIKVTTGPMLPVDRNGNTTYVTSSIPQDSIGRALLADSGIITQTGGGQVEYLTVPVAGGGTATYTINYEYVPVQTSFGVSYITDPQGEQMLVVQSIVLPDGSSYSFGYNQSSFGEVTSMTLPHGGQVTFQYQTAPGLNISNADTTTVLPTRWVQSHTGSDGTTTFQWSESSSSPYSQAGTTCHYIQNQLTTLSAQNTYKFSHCGGNILLQETDHGVANSTQIDAVDLYSYDTTHACPSWSEWVPGSFYNLPYTYTTQPCTGFMWMNLTGKTTKLLPPPGSSAATLTTDIQYVYGNPGTGRPTAVKQWDYYAASPTSLPDNPPGLPTRETDFTYGYVVNGQLFPTEIDERGSAGAIAASTYYTYDEAAYQSGAAPSTTPNHNDAYVTGNRGNVTTVTRCCGWNGTSYAALSSHIYYDDAGAVTATVDPNGNKSSMQYDPTDLYPQTVTLPPTGSPAVSHVIQQVYDFNSGQLQKVTDQNNATTIYGWDSIGRPSTIQVQYPGLSSPITLQTTTYPTANETEVSVLQSSGVYLSAASIVDSYGRPAQGVQSGTTSETTYDAQGRKYSVTNAHLSTPSSTDGTTYYYYDELNRPKTIKIPNGYSTSYTYSQNSVTITDPTGRSKQTTSDAFGDTVTVLEPNASGVLTYATNYQYNWQGQPVGVQQQGGTTDTTQWRQRSFAYDGAGRLISQTTPEAGTATFAYDNNGNVVRATNQNGSNNTTTSSYDALNRIISNAISGGPTYTYTYDGQDASGDTYGKGRLTGTSNGSNVQTLYQHDAMGRVISTAYCLPSDCTFTYGAQAQYDYQNNMTSLTYPDGRAIQWTYDQLNHPLSQTYASFKSSTVGTPYAASLSYYPSGQFQQGSFGGIIQAGATYDADQNLSSLAYTVNGTPIVEKTYAWDTNATNLVTVNDLAAGRTQNYSYDEMNRLSTMSDTGTTTNACTAGLPGVPATSQIYTIDPWGNLQASGTFSFQATVGANNQIAPGEGYQYDSAGNQTQDALGNSYSYRSDGLMNGSNGWSYTYDALGQRVRKDGTSANEYFYFGGRLLAMRNPSTGAWTDRIYGPTGALATVPGTVTGAPVYRLSDHLGSLHYTIGASGTIQGVSSVYPFGESATNSTGDNFVFTDHERDTENNTDATLYRHYASTQGRWLSPDPSNGSYVLTDPQSLNRYAYLTNRPMAHTDRLGLDDDDDDDDGGGGDDDDDDGGWSGDDGGGGDPGYIDSSDSGDALQGSSDPGGAPVYAIGWFVVNGSTYGVGDYAQNVSDSTQGLEQDGLADYPYLQGMFHGAGQPYWGGAYKTVVAATKQVVLSVATIPLAPLMEFGLAAQTAEAGLSAESAEVATEGAGELSGTIRASFANGRYTSYVTKADTLVYRGENIGQGVGRFFGTVRPMNSLDAEMMYNTLKWGNYGQVVSTYMVPAGTRVFVGEVAGGTGTQMFINSADVSGVQLLSQETLFESFLQAAGRVW